MNLVVNAGTRPTAVASHRRETAAGAIENGLAPGEYICLSVEDDGEGIDEKTLAKALSAESERLALSRVFESATKAPQWRKTMPKEAHEEAAKHHENAAKSHKTAAEQHGKGDKAAAAKHSTEAHGHSSKAHESSTKAHGKSSSSK